MSRPESVQEPLPPIRSIAAVRHRLRTWRKAGHEITFVPTMGALHAGHCRLIERATGPRRRAVVSVFVNPLQFGPREDLAAYPRTLAADARLAAKAGAALLFVPRADQLYPDGFSTRVRVGELDRHLCGPFRPGHFEGVATVVLKLLNIVQPDRLFLGQKDAQQAAIIRRMIRDLDLPVRLEVVPTVREADGLALSSRNRYLTREERAQAPRLYQALGAARAAIRGGERSARRIVSAARAVLHRPPALRVQYLELVDADSLTPRDPIGPRSLIALAVSLGGARLIDNVIVSTPKGVPPSRRRRPSAGPQQSRREHTSPARENAARK